MLEDRLKKLGLNNKETEVFRTVAERGKATAQQIHRFTGITRTTVYSVLKELVLKGFIVEEMGTSQKYFYIPDQDYLKRIYTKEKQRLEEKNIALNSLIEEVASAPKSSNYSVPKIRFYDEIQLEDALYSRLNKWIESAEKTGQKTWWGYQDSTWIKIFPDWVKHYWEIAPKEIGAKFLTNDTSSKNQEFDERRQVKYVDTNKHNFTSNNVVLGEYVIFVVTKSKPYYMVEINDSVIAHNTREVFKLLWNTL